MNPRLTCLFFAISIPAAAQSSDALYQKACGPKDADFTIDLVKQPAPAAPEPGKALVYILQKDAAGFFSTRIGLDGKWAGVVFHNSYVPISVTPGEHHFCVATQNKKHPDAELFHLNAEAGKTYYYLVRGVTVDGSPAIPVMLMGPVDRDEALYLIASSPQSVAKPKP